MTRSLPPERLALVEPVLGILNFASSDPGAPLLSAVNRLYRALEPPEDTGEGKRWETARDELTAGLEQLSQSAGAFARSEQARAVLALLYEDLLPQYRAFHRDLLFHQPDEGLFQAFFVGRAMGKLLDQGSPWDQTARVVEGAIASLNDYIGFRPVATLETQKIEPYAHEWVAPLPLYVRNAGVAAGRYREVVEKALEILGDAPAGILRQAQFSVERIETLALDPRAYDFDHPVNKRPNYHFGLWDPTKVGQDGFYSRFIVQQVTMDALVGRIRQRQDLDRAETTFEAAAVLAGIVLMASAISGAGPGSIDSQTSVADLLPRIAGFRDDFYRHLITRISGSHLARLDEEAKQLKQPFAGARQHLNAELAARRASQLERAHLARIYSRMGYETEARETLRHVQTPSARMNCAMDCVLFSSQKAVRQGRLSDALAQLQELRYTLVRGIECGALVDPWNILGFDGQFPLFANAEGSVHDHRVQEIVSLMELTYQAYSRILNEATARGDEEVARQADREFLDAVQWWRRYAAHEVASVESPDPDEAYKAARHVADALRVWHEGGAATGDVKFWAPFVELFDSPRAYAMVIDVLLEKRDYVASQALLMHWLSRASDVGLERGEAAFHEQAALWLHRLRREAGPVGDADSLELAGGPSAAKQNEESEGSPHLSLGEVWRLTVRFFDYLEPNAGVYWQAPKFSPGGDSDSGRKKKRSEPDWEGYDEDEEENDDQRDTLFGAAWEEVSYRDSTDDGNQGSIYESGPSSDDALEAQTREIQRRLSFLNTLASLWKLAVMTPAAALQDGLFGGEAAPTLEQFRDPLQRWLKIAIGQRRSLLALADEIHSYRIPSPGPEQESMVDYDRRRHYKESALEQAIHAAIEAADASRLFLAADGALAFAGDARERDSWERSADFLDADERLAIRVLSAALGRDVARIRELWSELVETLRTKSLLYVPVAKGGDIRQIVNARIWHRTMIDLLSWLPRLGLLTETCELLETARDMERNNPVGPGAVTEYDELFRSGYLALVQTLVRCSREWTAEESQAFLRELEDEARANSPASSEETDGSESDEARAKAEAESEANRSFLDPNVSAELDEQPLVEALQRALEPLLMCWLQHSRTLRLSVLERVSDPRAWERVVKFIQAYGKDLFTQKFFHQPNLRAILHQGAKNWLDKLKEQPGAEAPFKLLRDYEEGELEEGALDSLTLVLETILENYPEYRDYNSTTTQSDRGEMLFTLLDFLRLRTRYDRLAWNLKPVVWTHEILVRARLDQAAHAWRESLRRRIDDEAKTYLTQLGELQKKYAMRIPTVSDRLSERFMRPLEIDQLRALVRPAMTIDDSSLAAAEFAKLRDIAERFVQSPSGVGLDLPRWLLALEDETEKVRQPLRSKERYETRTVLRVEKLSLAEIKRQMDAWKRLE